MEAIWLLWCGPRYLQSRERRNVVFAGGSRVRVDAEAEHYKNIDGLKHARALAIKRTPNTRTVSALAHGESNRDAETDGRRTEACWGSDGLMKAREGEANSEIK